MFTHVSSIVVKYELFVYFDKVSSPFIKAILNLVLNQIFSRVTLSLLQRIGIHRAFKGKMTGVQLRNLEMLRGKRNEKLF